jgi:hypothetical protein
MTLKGSRTVATGGVEKRALGNRALHRPTNLSNEQIAHELSLNESDVHQMTTELRDGIVKKNRK